MGRKINKNKKPLKHSMW